MKPEIQKPEIERKGGATSIDVVVNLNHGMLLRSANRMSDECRAFVKDAGKLPDGRERKIYLVNSYGEYNCASIIDILTAAPVYGGEFKVKVDGEDETAEKLALRVYSALTSENSLCMDFYRFEEG